MGARYARRAEQMDHARPDQARIHRRRDVEEVGRQISARERRGFERDVYVVTAKPDLKNITAVRVEAMTDASLPKGGPGATTAISCSPESKRKSSTPSARSDAEPREINLKTPSSTIKLTGSMPGRSSAKSRATSPPTPVGLVRQRD